MITIKIEFSDEILTPGLTHDLDIIQRRFGYTREEALASVMDFGSYPHIERNAKIYANAIRAEREEKE